jgi:hypothetical protein
MYTNSGYGRRGYSIQAVLFTSAGWFTDDHRVIMCHPDMDNDIGFSPEMSTCLREVTM